MPWWQAGLLSASGGALAWGVELVLPDFWYMARAEPYTPFTAKRWAGLAGVLLFYMLMGVGALVAAGGAQTVRQAFVIGLLGELAVRRILVAVWESRAATKAQRAEDQVAGGTKATPTAGDTAD